MRGIKNEERIKWLEKQIDIQMDAMTWCNINEVPVHRYLLEQVTKEWIDLTEKEFKRREREGR